MKNNGFYIINKVSELTHLVSQRVIYFVFHSVSPKYKETQSDRGPLKRARAVQLLRILHATATDPMIKSEAEALVNSQQSSHWSDFNYFCSYLQRNFRGKVLRKRESCCNV